MMWRTGFTASGVVVIRPASNCWGGAGISRPIKGVLYELLPATHIFLKVTVYGTRYGERSVRRWREVNVGEKSTSLWEYYNTKENFNFIQFYKE